MTKRKGGRNRAVDRQTIFNLLRKRIAEELKADGLDVKQVSQLELAIGTFVPSQVVNGFRISDYPFIGARYVSLRDGHVYIVAGSTDDGLNIMAYRLGFLQSVCTLKGGIAVGISEDGWMDSGMILYSLEHAHFEMRAGVIEGVNQNAITRRTYPIKKAKVYAAFLRNLISKRGQVKE